MIINSGTINMLTQAYSAAFDKGFKGFGVDQDWSKVASLQPSTTKTGVYPYLGNFTKLREWVGDRIIKNFQEYDYTLDNRKFEATVEVKRETIEDDQYGVYSGAFQNAGASVKVWPDDLVFAGNIPSATDDGKGNYAGAVLNGATNLCYDGQPFFNDSHPVQGSTMSNYDSTTGTDNNTGGHLWMLVDNSKPIMPFLFQLRAAPEITARMNLQDPAVFDRDVFTWGIRARGAAGYGFWQLAYGSTNDLSITNFRTYRASMKAYTSDEGFKLGVTPKILVCGPSLEAAARDLLKRQLVPTTVGGTTVMASNAEFEAVDLLVTTRLP
jgi:phage major head subunit gpT-like protein